MATFFEQVAALWPMPLARMPTSTHSWPHPPAELSSTGRRFIFMTLPAVRDRIPGNQGPSASHRHTNGLVVPLLREGVAIGAIRFAVRKSVRSQKNRLRFSKPLPIKRSSRSRTCDCSKKSKSATQNCARLWSIRRQPPRCSASSAARPRTCSRCSTPSSRAPRGFAGLMMWCCDSARGTSGYAGSFWSHTHWPRRDQY